MKTWEIVMLFLATIILSVMVGIPTGKILSHDKVFYEGYYDGFMEGVDFTSEECYCDCDCKEYKPDMIYNEIFTCDCPDEPQLLRVLRGVAEEVEYDGSVSGMVCRHKAPELRRRLIKYGYKNVEIIDGQLRVEEVVDENNSKFSWIPHDFVCFVDNRGKCILPMESVTGNIPSPDYYNDNYRDWR